MPVRKQWNVCKALKSKNKTRHLISCNSASEKKKNSPETKAVQNHFQINRSFKALVLEHLYYNKCHRKFFRLK